ncbi:MAG: putative lipid II flippase FtsW [Spirochaetes bacterium]|nr:putative lipid II flippase FtsW [Spirochaetota bacterium]
MAGNFIIEKDNRQSCDFFLILIIILLLGIGLSFLFSASYANAIRLNRPPEFFLLRQLPLVVLGILGALLIMNLPVETIKRFVFILLLVSLVLSVFVLITGQNIQGARRWIPLGMLNRTFQPSEIAKLALILYLADFLSKKEEKLNNLYTLSHPVVIILLFVLLTFAQNDFSTAIFLIFVSATIFFIAGIKYRYFLSAIIAVIPFLILLLFNREHRVRRLVAFINPESDPLGVGYQILQAREALISGGFWGMGIGSGVRKLGALPEAHSDFIFAVVGEEVGFIGIFLIIILFTLFAVRGYLIAFRCTDKFSFYAAFGITTSIFYQSIMNMAVVAGAIPSTGVPLPFFSHGGSSIFITLLMCGMLLNFSKHLKTEKVYRHE